MQIGRFADSFVSDRQIEADIGGGKAMVFTLLCKLKNLKQFLRFIRLYVMQVDHTRRIGILFETATKEKYLLCGFQKFAFRKLALSTSKLRYLLEIDSFFN